MSKINIGDKVRILENPTLSNETEYLVGKEFEIVNYANDCSDYVLDDDTDYVYSEDWLELVEEEKCCVYHTDELEPKLLVVTVDKVLDTTQCIDTAKAIEKHLDYTYRVLVLDKGASCYIED